MVHPNDAEEPMLRDEPGRSKYVIHPVRHHRMYEMAEKAEATLWSTGEVQLDKDLADLAEMSPALRRLILTILAFFAASDGIVNENLGQRFMAEVKWPEALLFYSIQVGIEGIHSKMYSMLISAYVPDPAEQARLFNAIETMPCVAAKARWALAYANDPELAFGTRVAAFVIVEGLFFQQSFCAINYLRSRGIMPGLTFSNELISRDEGLHTDFGCLMFETCKHKPSERAVADMMRSALDVEFKFIDDAMPKAGIPGMNAELMKTYARYTANRLMTKLGFAPLFGKDDPPHHMPFSFMENQGTENKTNFFEGRVGEYQKPVTKQAGTPAADAAFEIDMDF